MLLSSVAPDYLHHADSQDEVEQEEDDLQSDVVAQPGQAVQPIAYAQQHQDGRHANQAPAGKVRAEQAHEELVIAVQGFGSCGEQQGADQQVLDVVEDLRAQVPIQQVDVLFPKLAHASLLRMSVVVWLASRCG